MTVLEILHERPKKSDHVIFVSAGDRESFASLALRQLAGFYDIIIFYYDSDPRKQQSLSDGATVFAKGVGSKFNALKALYDQRPDLISRYKTIWICDDDIVPEFGDVRSLPAAAELHDVKILSPAHSRMGKISKLVMLPRAGSHYLRYVTYVENTCPVFQTSALESFFQVFDGSLVAYGDDWWYLQTLGVDQQRAKAGIVDAVTIINPRDQIKPGGLGELERMESVADQKARWHRRRAELGLKNEWTPRTLGKLTISPQSLQGTIYDFRWFARSVRSQFRILFNDLNYFIRFYTLRKRINALAGRNIV